MHCNVLLLDYRGYGKSQGNPSEQGLIMDAQVFILFTYQLKKRLDLISCTLDLILITIKSLFSVLQWVEQLQLL